MLRSLEKLNNYRIHATDGELGKVRDFYFDDQYWTIRYIIADTRKWLPGRLVLISPFVLQEPDWFNDKLPVDLTTDQVKESPEIDEAKPVSRQKEAELVRYYGWPTYWAGVGNETPGALPISGEAVAEREVKETTGQEENDPHLRSTQEVFQYQIHAKDGEIGHVDDFIIEDNTWIIRYLIIDTRKWLHWLPGGKKVLISPQWVRKVDWAESEVIVDLSREQIENSPEFDPSVPVNRDYEVRLYDYYGRPVYWE